MSWTDRIDGEIVRNSVWPNIDWNFHKLLISILKGIVNSNRVIALRGGECICSSNRLTLFDERPGLGELGINQEEYDLLIREPVVACHWFYPSEKDAVIEEILRGNKDAACPMLMCICKSLAAIEVPFGDESSTDSRHDPFGCLPRFSWMMEIVIRVTLAHNGEYTDVAMREDMPLQCLELIETPAVNGEYAFPLEEAAYLVGLPSLKLVILDKAFDSGNFDGWPLDALIPRCPEIFIDQGAIPLETIKNFARAWHKPCVFYQYWQDPNSHGIDGPEVPQWSSCRIELTPSGATRFTSEPEPEYIGGNITHNTIGPAMAISLASIAERRNLAFWP